MRYAIAIPSGKDNFLNFGCETIFLEIALSGGIYLILSGRKYICALIPHLFMCIIIQRIIYYFSRDTEKE
jgi:hypothetical protein